MILFTILWTISICFMLCFQVLADFSLSFGWERNSMKKNLQVQARAAPAGRNVYRDIVNKPSLVSPAGRKVSQ